MIERTFNSGFRIRLHQEDMNLAVAIVRELQMSLPNTAAAQELFNCCAADGGACLDHSAMVMAMEISGNYKVGD